MYTLLGTAQRVNLLDALTVLQTRNVSTEYVFASRDSSSMEATVKRHLHVQATVNNRHANHLVLPLVVHHPHPHRYHYRHHAHHLANINAPANAHLNAVIGISQDNGSFSRNTV